MRNFPRQNFEPLCHNGGDYHACDSTRFVGCCDVNPCVAGGGCNVDALKPMSFQKNLFSMAFHDQVCSTGSWYTCADTIPPFIGCCKSNPCATTSGCPDGDLVQGSLSSNPYDAALWFSVAKLDSPATTSAPALATSASSGHNLNGGAIAGLALGLAALVIFLVAALFFYRRRKAVATESRGYETKNLVEAHLTEMYPTPSRGDAASGVHEAPVTNVAPKEFRSSGYPGNSSIHRGPMEGSYCTKRNVQIHYIPHRPPHTPPITRSAS